MNILITGVNGFIGKHLFSSLKNHNLIGIDLNESDDIIKCDILDKKNLSKLFEKNKFDLCIHLASLNNIQESIDYPKLYYKNILEGTHNLLLECSIYNTKFIFASTWMVYETNDNKLNENSLVNPKNTFVSAKLSCEYLVNTFNSSYDIDTVVLRIFNTYGPGKKYGVVYHFLNKKLKNETLEIYGDGSQNRDLLYIDDLIDAIKIIIETDKANGQLLNLGYSEDISIKNLAEHISENIKYEEHLHQNSEVKRVVCDNSKVKELLNWEPKVSLNQGILNTMEWLKNELT